MKKPKENFEDRLIDIVQEALDFIKANVKNGQTIVFLTEDEREENDSLLYDLPTASKVTKHGFYDEFALTSVTNKKGEITFNGIARGEGDDDDEISLDNIENTSLCAIADLINETL